VGIFESNTCEYKRICVPAFGPIESLTVTPPCGTTTFEVPAFRQDADDSNPRCCRDSSSETCPVGYTASFTMIGQLREGLCAQELQCEPIKLPILSNLISVKNCSSVVFGVPVPGFIPPPTSTSDDENNTNNDDENDDEESNSEENKMDDIVQQPNMPPTPQAPSDSISITSSMFQIALIKVFSL